MLLVKDVVVLYTTTELKMKMKINNGLVKHHESYEEIEIEVFVEEYEWFKENKDSGRKFDIEGGI